MNITWHYKGRLIWAGTTPEGYDVEKDVKTGRVKRIYPLDMKQQAMACASIRGAAFASRRYNIPAGTIRSWAKRAA